MTDSLTRAIRGGRFDGAKAAPLDQIKDAPGTLRSIRFAVEAAMKRARMQVASLQRDFDRGEIGAERFAREREKALERPLAVLHERYGKARETFETALAGFKSEWSDLAALGRLASRDGSLATFLQSLPEDALVAQVQGFLNRGEIAKAADAALLRPEIRAEVLRAVELPGQKEARVAAAATAREMSWIEIAREHVLKNDLSEPRSDKLWAAQMGAMKPYAGVTVDDVEKASAPRTDVAVRDYQAAVGEMNAVDADVKAESEKHANEPAPNGLDTMTAAFRGAKK